MNSEVINTINEIIMDLKMCLKNRKIIQTTANKNEVFY